MKVAVAKLNSPDLLGGIYQPPNRLKVLFDGLRERNYS